MREIVGAIEADGPMPVDRYMAFCLGHPAHGYYATRDPFGSAGDFTTAPEISQMFGELIGLWCAEVWRMMGAPPRVALVELGSGRGTLMADLLRAAAALPAFREAIEVTLVETSPTLRAIQQKTLAAHPVRWATAVEDALAPVGRPAIVVSNEFFDALPVRQFVRRDGRWLERVVGLDGDRLAFGLAPAPAGFNAATDRDALEVSPDAVSIAARLASHVAAHGGAALAIDYGADATGEDTLQAVRAHRFVDPLIAPGEADLTAHVDFSALAAAARAKGAAVMGLISQAEFLERLGLPARAERLSARASDAQRAAIAAAASRLTDRAPTGMGAMFKALAFGHPALGALPGFTLAQEGTGS